MRLREKECVHSQSLRKIEDLHYASAYRDPCINKTYKRKLNADIADHNDVLQLLRKGVFEISA